MSDIILHHYPNSPFSEKIRLIFGYKGINWQSVIIPVIMPKPDVVALTGGYRKTPFMQIGADIYCDSALICDVLEMMQPEPTLYPEHQKGAARIIAQWADTTLFWAAMAYNFSPAGSAQMFGIDTTQGSPQATEAIANAKMFAEDRAKMRLGAPRLPAADAAASYKSYLRRIANMLDEHPFLMGDKPCIADFAVYHPLWFTRHRTPVMAGIFDATPDVLTWMDRMAAIGHAQSGNLTAIDSIAIAAMNTPASIKNSAENATFQDEHGIPPGSMVTIASETFGPEPTQGELVAATRMHYTLRRKDERAGIVHVHFPRIGFVLKKVEH
jgi:glutathione S-transferase